MYWRLGILYCLKLKVSRKTAQSGLSKRVNGTEELIKAKHNLTFKSWPLGELCEILLYNDEVRGDLAGNLEEDDVSSVPFALR